MNNPARHTPTPVRTLGFVMLIVARSSLHLLLAVLGIVPAIGCASTAPERSAVVDVSAKQIAASDPSAAGRAEAEADQGESGLGMKISGPDTDDDGLLDSEDSCPNDAEDRDGFQDGDGCPDPDNDADGILDVSDKCPNVPETMNGFADEDGCPDANIDRAKLAFREGATAFAQGDYVKARKFFEEAYNLEPRDPVLYNIAMSAERQGDRRYACQYYRQWRATPHGANSPNNIPSLETCP